MSGARYAVGLDIGGSGIKAAVVDVDAGELAAERLRLPTPEGGRPDEVVLVASAVVAKVVLSGPAPTARTVGVGFPAVVQHGVTRTAANVHSDWIGAPAADMLTAAVERPCVVANDADVAGLAEVRFGAGRDVAGVVVVTTLGTGIGSALFVDGVLVPNTEFGHLEIDGVDAESRAADSAREREDLSWKDWARRLQRYYSQLELLLQPDLIVVGGGVSKKHDKFLPMLDLRCSIVPAELRNEAGIIGAAVMAAESDTKDVAWTEQPTPGPGQIRVNMPDDLAGGDYADFVRVWHGKDIFTLDFAALVAPMSPEGTTARVVSRVRIPPSQVFEIMKALERSLTAWEKEHGQGA